jgi:hypothetical protein
MRRWLQFVVLLIALPACAQISNVTGQVVDTDGTTWNSATCTIALTWNHSQFPSNTPYRSDTLQPINIAPSCAVNGSGALTATVTDIAFVVPANSTWTFNICPAVSSPRCGTFNVPVTGSSENISTQITAGIPPPRIGGGTGQYAYADVEVLEVPNTSYYNTVTQFIRCYGNAWANCFSNSGGGATFPNTNGLVKNTSTTTSVTAVGSRDGTGDYQQPITVVGLGGGLTCALVGTQWQCTLSGGGLTGTIQSGPTGALVYYPPR